VFPDDSDWLTGAVTRQFSSLTQLQELVLRHIGTEQQPIVLQHLPASLDWLYIDGGSSSSSDTFGGSSSSSSISSRIPFTGLTRLELSCDYVGCFGAAAILTNLQHLELAGMPMPPGMQYNQMTILKAIQLTAATVC
jgi:hypothetical protein